MRNINARRIVDSARARELHVAAEGRLLARAAPVVGSAPRGLQRLGLDTRRDGLLYVPVDYEPSRPAPLVLMLHGAGGSAQHGLHPFQGLANRYGLILLAPDSRDSTWDVILGEYGPDVRFIERALTQTLGRYAVDPERIAVGASRTALPTRCRWVLSMAICSALSRPSRQASWPPRGGRDFRASISRTVRRMRCCPSITAAGGSCR